MTPGVLHIYPSWRLRSINSASITFYQFPKQENVSVGQGWDLNRRSRRQRPQNDIIICDTINLLMVNVLSDIIPINQTSKIMKRNSRLPRLETIPQMIHWITMHYISITQEILTNSEAFKTRSDDVAAHWTGYYFLYTRCQYNYSNCEVLQNCQHCFKFLILYI